MVQDQALRDTQKSHPIERSLILVVVLTFHQIADAIEDVLNLLLGDGATKPQDVVEILDDVGEYVQWMRLYIRHTHA